MLSNCGVGGDFFFFWLCWVFVSVCGLSLVVTNRGYSLIVVHGLLIVVASLVVEHRVQCVPVSVAAALRLSCPSACGIFPDQGSSPGPLNWQVDS